MKLLQGAADQSAQDLQSGKTVRAISNHATPAARKSEPPSCCPCAFVILPSLPYQSPVVYSLMKERIELMQCTQYPCSAVDECCHCVPLNYLCILQAVMCKAKLMSLSCCNICIYCTLSTSHCEPARKPQLRSRKDQASLYIRWERWWNCGY